MTTNLTSFFPTSDSSNAYGPHHLLLQKFILNDKWRYQKRHPACTEKENFPLQQTILTSCYFIQFPTSVMRRCCCCCCCSGSRQPAAPPCTTRQSDWGPAVSEVFFRLNWEQGPIHIAYMTQLRAARDSGQETKSYNNKHLETQNHVVTHMQMITWIYKMDIKSKI